MVASSILDKTGFVRLPTIAAAQRAALTKTPCATALPHEVDQALQTLLQRACHYIDQALPSISSTLFDTDSLTTLMQQSLQESNNNRNHNHSQEIQASHNHEDNNNHPPTTPPLKFSSREPAVNVYTPPGGAFLAHKDAQALTLLVVLSSSSSDDKDAGNYVSQGGGTAFWTQEARGHRVEAPSLIVTPKQAGTALLFGGCVTHAGLPVTEGPRVVFVASFSRPTALSTPVQQIVHWDIYI